MHIPVILAHGALGAWDELIFLGVGAIFLIMMGISWFKSRTMTPDLDQPDQAATAEPDPSAPDHFRLE